MLARLNIASRLGVLATGFALGMLVIGALVVNGLQQQEQRDRMRAARQTVERAHNLLGELARRQPTSGLSVAQTQQLALALVRSLRSGNPGELWLSDSSHYPLLGERSVAPAPGQNPESPIAEVLAGVERHVDQQGAGFVAHDWPAAENGPLQPGLSFVAQFQPWHWVIGSRVANDDAALFGSGQALPLAVAGIVAIAMLILLTLAVSRSISHPLAATTGAVARMSRGEEQRNDLPQGEHGELGDLVEALTALQAHLLESDKLQRAREARIQREHEALHKLSRAVEQSPGAIIITDPQGQIEYVNEKFVETTGYERWEAIGRNPRFLKSGLTPAKTYKEMWETLTAGREWRGELHNRRKSGSTYWEHALISPIKRENGATSHYLAVKEDVTVRKYYEERLLHQANYDSLTDLPNRVLAMDRLQHSLALAHRRQHKVAVLFIDLDNFKTINDTLGHASGDRLLVETAIRLRNRVRKEDTVARLGGDEFLVVIPEVETPEAADTVASHILGAFAEPFTLGTTELTVGASIGITLAPLDGYDAHDLMRNADAAMYQAKHAGRNTYRFFASDVTARIEQRTHMSDLLQRALERGELQVHYQPLIATDDHGIYGAEALLRWHNPELGDVPPETFIPIAEESGVIITLGEWVLEQACQTARRWQNIVAQPLTVAVNVSARQFLDGDFAESLRRILNKAHLEPERLALEITERALMEDTLQTDAVLHRLRRTGIRLTVDDFGAGDSSLSRLKRYPVDCLKIDRPFVRDCIEDAEDAELIAAIIEMAKELGLAVIGEGVETEEQFQLLRQHGCQVVQGHLWSPALPEETFARLIREGIPLKSAPPNVVS